MSYHYARRPQQHLSATSREETPATPCVGRWDVYDALVDHKGGPEFYAAIYAAQQLCGSCPIAASCLRENRKEDWVKALATPIKKPATTTDACGSFRGASAHDRRREELCQPCRDARSVKHAEYKARRRAVA